MTILSETNDGGNYAAERLVGTQEIDPDSSGETAGYHGWLYRVNRQDSEATVQDILTLEGRYQETAQHLARTDSEASKYRALFDMCDSNFKALQDEHDLVLKRLGDLQVKFDVISAANTNHIERMSQYRQEANELQQGCSWLAETLRATETCWNLAEHECTEVAGRLAVEQNRHDTTKRLLSDGDAECADLEQGINDLAQRCQDAEAVIAGLCGHDPDVVSALYFCSRKRKAAERDVSRLEAKCEQIELAYSDLCDTLEAGAKRGDELADVLRQIAACEQAPSSLENPLLEVPAELYQRLMCVAAELGDTGRG